MRRRLMVAWLLLILSLAACDNVAAPVETPRAEDAFYAWDFTSEALDGPPITLSELHGRWVVINFWATWCGPCVAEMKSLQELADANADRLTVVAINQREPVSTVRDFVEAHNLRFTVLINPPDQILIDYSVIGLPQTVVVDPAGVVVWRQFGPVNFTELSVVRAF